MLFPYYWMVVNSLKGPRGFTADPYSLIPKTFSLESMRYRVEHRPHRPSTCATASCMPPSCSSCRPSSTRWRPMPSPASRFRAANPVPGVLATMMLPYSVLLIPTYLIVWRLGLANTIAGVVVPGFASAYGIFMLRQFFLNIPMELEDAARIDGCSRAAHLLPDHPAPGPAGADHRWAVHLHRHWSRLHLAAGGAQQLQASTHHRGHLALIATSSRSTTTAPSPPRS